MVAETSFLTSFDPHLGQVMSFCVVDEVISSNVSPHALQENSKRGMPNSLGRMF
jgi:hypothetical protein